MSEMDVFMDTIVSGAMLDHGASPNGSVDADYLKWQLANWTPAPRVDKYADITAMLPEVAE